MTALANPCGASCARCRLRADGVILGLYNLPRFILIRSLKARAFAVGIVHAIIRPATAATEEEAITCVHGVHAIATIKRTDSGALTGNRRVVPALARIVTE